MFKQVFETGATPHITITECLGNLVVRGSEKQQVDLRLQGDGDLVTLEQEGDTFTLTAPAGCHITCPTDTILTVGSVMGNLKAEGVKGSATIETVYGNVTLRAIGPVSLEQTYGNLRVRQGVGDLRVQTTRGSVRIRQMTGDISMAHVDGNLTVEGLYGGLTVEKVRGNIRLGATFSPGQVYRLNTGSNLTVHIPADASLSLSLLTDRDVRSSVPGLALEEIDGGVQGILGSGEASLEAKVRGNVSLRSMGSEEEMAEAIPLDFVVDLEGLGAQIEANITESMAQMEVRLEESLGRIDSDQFRFEMEQVKEQALRRTEKVAQKTRQAAEREAERARMRAERAERRWRRASGKKSRSKREPASDEERMRVLRMVEEGKVTPEQAAELLAVLEGRG